LGSSSPNADPAATHTTTIDAKRTWGKHTLRGEEGATRRASAARKKGSRLAKAGAVETLSTDEKFFTGSRDVTDARFHHETVPRDVESLGLDLEREVDLIADFEFSVSLESQSANADVERFGRDAVSVFRTNLQAAPKREAFVISPVCLGFHLSSSYINCTKDAALDG